MTSTETLSPFGVMAMLALAFLWYALIYIQKSRIVAKYEQDPSLADSYAVRTAKHWILRPFGPGVRAVYYSTHLALIFAMPDGLRSLHPGYRDLGPRRAILSKFSASDLVLALASTSIGCALVVYVLVRS